MHVTDADPTRANTRVSRLREALPHSLLAVALAYVLIVRAPLLVPAALGSLPGASQRGGALELPVLLSVGLVVVAAAALLFALSRALERMHRNAYAALAPVLAVFIGVLHLALRVDLPLPGFPGGHVGEFVIVLGLLGGALLTQRRGPATVLGWGLIVGPALLLLVALAAARGPGSLLDVDAPLWVPIALLLGGSLMLALLGTFAGKGADATYERALHASGDEHDAWSHQDAADTLHDWREHYEEPDEAEEWAAAAARALTAAPAGYAGYPSAGAAPGAQGSPGTHGARAWGATSADRYPARKPERATYDLRDTYEQEPYGHSALGPYDAASPDDEEEAEDDDEAWENAWARAARASALADPLAPTQRAHALAADARLGQNGSRSASKEISRPLQRPVRTPPNGPGKTTLLDARMQPKASGERGDVLQGEEQSPRQTGRREKAARQAELAAREDAFARLASADEASRALRTTSELVSWPARASDASHRERAVGDDGARGRVATAPRVAAYEDGPRRLAAEASDATRETASVPSRAPHAMPPAVSKGETMQHPNDDIETAPYPAQDGPEDARPTFDPARFALGESEPLELEFDDESDFAALEDDEDEPTAIARHPERSDRELDGLESQANEAPTRPRIPTAGDEEEGAERTSPRTPMSSRAARAQRQHDEQDEEALWASARKRAEENEAEFSAPKRTKTRPPPVPAEARAKERSAKSAPFGRTTVPHFVAPLEANDEPESELEDALIWEAARLRAEAVQRSMRSIEEHAEADDRKQRRSHGSLAPRARPPTREPARVSRSAPPTPPAPSEPPRRNASARAVGIDPFGPSGAPHRPPYEMPRSTHPLSSAPPLLPALSNTAPDPFAPESNELDPWSGEGSNLAFGNIAERQRAGSGWRAGRLLPPLAAAVVAAVVGYAIVARIRQSSEAGLGAGASSVPPGVPVVEPMLTASNAEPPAREASARDASASPVGPLAGEETQGPANRTSSRSKEDGDSKGEQRLSRREKRKLEREQRKLDREQRRAERRERRKETSVARHEAREEASAERDEPKASGSSRESSREERKAARAAARSERAAARAEAREQREAKREAARAEREAEREELASKRETARAEREAEREELANKREAANAKSESRSSASEVAGRSAPAADRTAAAKPAAPAAESAPAAPTKTATTFGRPTSSFGKPTAPAAPPPPKPKSLDEMLDRIPSKAGASPSAVDDDLDALMKKR